MISISENDVLRFFEDEANRPLSTREAIELMEIPAEYRSSLRKLLRQMSKDGLLIKLKKGKYSLPSKMKLVRGRIHAHPDGFGFVLPEDEGVSDLFISPKKMREVMHGDRVICRIEHTHREKSEGSVVRIIERGQKQVVGVFDRTSHLSYIIPIEKRMPRDIPIPNKHTMGAKRGQAVVVEITRYPTKTTPPEAKVIEILGRPDNPEIEMEMIIRKNGLPTAFQSKAMEEAKKAPMEIPSGEIDKRLDLRDQTIFTIDGETAKDFDDAISVEKKEDGSYLLGVHIADVSHYVTPGSYLDQEALERATSVYFPDRVIPMLPEELSNGICSLKPMEERLALSCFMEFDSSGKRIKFKIKDSIIKSAARLTYTRVAKVLDQDEKGALDEPGPKEEELQEKIREDLFLAKELALLLKKNRFENGSVDFDLPEPDIILDMRGKIENILQANRNIAHRIIEEFMLAANTCVAGFLAGKKKESIYRVHEPPTEEKLLALREFVNNFGLTMPSPSDFTAMDLQKILTGASGKPEEKLINHVALKSMKQAQYSENNIGHFCLAFDCYTHFTSPIRRYPDMVVHRLVRKYRDHKDPAKDGKKVATKPLGEVAKRSSELERRADEAEREVIKLKKAQFMMERIGEEHHGFISGVTSFGLFVELKDLFIEGLVHVSSMSDDYYIFRQSQHSLVGERRKKVYRLCDEVSVRVVNVSIERLRIDFELI